MGFDAKGIINNSLKGLAGKALDKAFGKAGASVGNEATAEAALAEGHWTLGKFRSNITNIARNQYFQVSIPMIGMESSTLTALARTTELPALTHQTMEVPYRGVQTKHLGTPTFADWTVTFLCDENHQLRNLFVNWLALSYSTSNLVFKVGSAYKCDNVQVSQLNSMGQVSTSVWFYGMFPTNIGQVSFDQAGGNFVTFDVTFAYDYYLMASRKLPDSEGGPMISVDNLGLQTENSY